MAVREKRTNVRVKSPAPLRWFGWLSSRVAPRWTAERLIDRMVRTRRRPSSEGDERFRATGERLELDVGGCRTRAWAHGPASGPRVLLLHGWDGSASDFRHVVPALVAAGFRTVSIDAPGHGARDGDTSNVLMSAAALVAAADRAGRPAAIVAHSFGAAAAGYAMAHGLSADRLVLLAPAPDPGAYVRGLAAVGGERLEREALAEMGRRVGVPTTAVSLGASAPRITVPVTVVHDRHDREVPLAGVEDVVAGWPSAELHRTSELGHRRLLRDPEVLALVVRAVSGLHERSCSHGELGGRCAQCGLERELYDRRTRWA